MPRAADGHLIAEATAADVLAIAGFFWVAWEEAGPDAPGWAGASETVIRELTEPEMILARLGGPERRMFLAWSGAEVVGFSATRQIGPDVIDLAGIVIRQSAVGSGFGGPLLETAISAAKAAGAQRLITRTESDNGRALRFYESHGFRRTGATTEDVEGAPIDLVTLELDLTG